MAAGNAWIYRHPAWTAARKFVLERDGGRCRLRLAGCTTTANHVDHIVRPANGGAPFDPTNLRASCAHCNTSRGARDRLHDLRGPAVLEPSRVW